MKRSEPRLNGLILVGSAARKLRRDLWDLVDLDAVTGDGSWIRFSMIGPPVLAGANARRQPGFGVQIEEWEGGSRGQDWELRLGELRRQEQEVIDALGLSPEELPVIVFVHDGEELMRVHLPVESWEGPRDFRALHLALMSVMSEAEVRKAAEGREGIELVQALRQVCERFRRKIRQSTPGDLVSTKRAVEISGRSRSTLIRAMNAGRIRSYRASDSGHHLWSVSELGRISKFPIRDNVSG